MNRKDNKRRPRPKQDNQTVYTAPKAFNRRRFWLQLATVFAVVLALVFGMSIFFKVETVKVAGVDKYTEYQVKQASGIEKGDNTMGLNKAAISSRIMQKLPYVESVRVGVSLPGTVNIQIKELNVTYAITDQNDAWWLMSADGKIVEKINGGDATTHTKILGVKLQDPQLAQQAEAYEPGPSVDEEGQTIPVTVYAQERLEMVKTILQELEKLGMLGSIASVDVTHMDGLTLWYADQYEISLGDSSQLAYKLGMIKSAIEQVGDYRTGNLDVTFAIQPDKVIFTPFE